MICKVFDSRFIDWLCFEIILMVEIPEKVALFESAVYSYSAWENLNSISKKYCKVVSRQPRLHFRFYGMPYVWLETLKLMNFNVTCIHMLKILLVFPPIKILMKRKYEASSRLCANFHLDKNICHSFSIFLCASFYKSKFYEIIIKSCFFAVWMGW